MKIGQNSELEVTQEITYYCKDLGDSQSLKKICNYQRKTSDLRHTLISLPKNL